MKELMLVVVLIGLLLACGATSPAPNSASKQECLQHCKGTNVATACSDCEDLKYEVRR